MTTTVEQWLARLKLSERHEDHWRTRAQACVDKYRDEKSARGSGLSRTHASDGMPAEATPKVQLLWANTETLKPALYSSTPQPVAKRRFSQEDPVARETAEVLERSISFVVDNGHDDFDTFAAQFVLDYLLVGRSVDRVRLRKVEDEDEIPLYEEIEWAHTPWLHFLYDPQARWQDVMWVAYGDHFFNEDELKKRFDLSAKDMARIAPQMPNVETGEKPDIQVWEIWCKRERAIKWVMQGYDEFLEEGEPEVALTGFYDCAKPLYSIPTNDTLIPIPEYIEYQYQAEEVNNLTRRIDKIVNAIRANGFYAGNITQDLSGILNSDDGTLLAVADFAALIEKGGIEGMISWLPVEQWAKVLQILTAQRQILIQQIYDLTGISDLMRGSTDPRETAKAQGLKASFGARRIQPRQLQVQRYVRDLFRIAAETIAEAYSRTTLEEMTGLPVGDEVLNMLRNDLERQFAIDVETDSTIAPDEQAEKQAVAEFMGAMAQFLPVAQQLASVGGGELAGQIILWAMRKFRAGRQIEQVIEEMLQKAAQQPQQSQQQQDPAAMKAMAELQLKAQDMQADNARADQTAQVKILETLEQLKLEQAETSAKIRDMERLTDAKIANLRDRSNAA